MPIEEFAEKIKLLTDYIIDDIGHSVNIDLTGHYFDHYVSMSCGYEVIIKVYDREYRTDGVNCWRSK